MKRHVLHLVTVLPAGLAALALAGCSTTSDLAQYAVTATADNGGTITRPSATVDSGGAAKFALTPDSGHVIGGGSDCSNSLSGSTYTTGRTTANCTVTASFVAAWTWAGGSDTVSARGVYGTEGVAAASSLSGERDDAVAWTDASGHLWLFGGTGPGSEDRWGYLNDLWRYPVQ